ncbi:MAG TPA: hypothetical protein VGP13_01185 [Candidatus Paceibacterota bacterium]|jgi:hypothetical protein|nr:hypothetical protein [Candidatus Paceibacterota bacterium]
MVALLKNDLGRLYLEERLSVRAIATLYKCSQQKVNYWIVKYKIRKRSISEAIYLQRNPRGDPFHFRPPQDSKDAFLFGLGLGLYWGEGTKRNLGSVRLGNTDPWLVKKFIDFLRRFYGIKEHKFRFGLQIFSDMKPQEAVRFWARTLGVSQKRFMKVIVTPARGVGNYREKTRHGVLTVYVSNTKLRNMLVGEIEKLSKVRYSARVPFKPK